MHYWSVLFKVLPSDFPFKRLPLRLPPFFFSALMMFLIGSWVTATSPPVSSPIIVRINPGDGFTEIAQRLKTLGLISSTRLFKFYSFLTGAAHRFRPGTYQLETSDNLFRIIQKLTRGPAPVTVTITEGWTLRDVDVKLAEAGVVEPGSIIRFVASPAAIRLLLTYPFLKELADGDHSPTLEGFLFPDTYKFFLNSNPETVVRALLDTFSAKAVPLLSGRSDWYTILILASLVEKEVSVDPDRALVAGILQKRLRTGMPLQVDASIVYLKCDGAFVTCAYRQLSRADFKLASPYNTYLNRGLPPTPIANPGLSALRAALNPRSSDHLFYLSDPATRRTIFSKTFYEHNNNRYQYLRL